MYGKGLIYQHFLQDPVKAHEVFTYIVEHYPDSKIAEIIRANWDKPISKFGEKDSTAQEEKPSEFSTLNYPNPFNPETEIQYSLPDDGRITLKIYDVMGREITTLVDANKLRGRYTIRWNGKDRQGRDVTSGMYFYQIRFKDQTLTRKLLLIR